jgi:quercetin dioxygenase-like cupin family protein
MTASPFVLRPTDRPSPLNVVGEHITVLASGTTTGSYELFLQEGPEGSGPVPHTHPWDESFFVTRGEVDFSLEDGGLLTATAGTLVHIPAGSKHWFRWRTGGGAMLSMTSRRGASAMFTEVHQTIAPDRPDVDKLIEIAVRHGLTACAV